MQIEIGVRELVESVAAIDASPRVTRPSDVA